MLVTEDVVNTNPTSTTPTLSTTPASPTIQSINNQIILDIAQKQILVKASPNDDTIILKVWIGESVGAHATFNTSTQVNTLIASFPDTQSELTITQLEGSDNDTTLEYQIKWTTRQTDWLEDRVQLSPAHWFGGSEVLIVNNK
jgi:hypothetical protein